MALTDFRFILLLACCTLACFLTPRRGKWLVLLAASAVFYASYGVGQVWYVLGCCAATYGAGLWLGRLNRAMKLPGADRARLKRHKKWVLAALILVDLGALVLLKYAGLLFSGAVGLVQPLGISFYTLSAIGYAVDVHRGKFEPEKNPLRLLLFIGFFLGVVQGPFARYDQIGQALREPNPASYENLKLGALRMLWGYLKKMVVADWLQIYVAQAFANPEDCGGAVMCAAVVLYTVQMYADFSGYMDIVCGAGQAMGILVPENFDRPLSARSVSEFWRRWHITLGAWFKDYVFYPVSVSRPAARLAKALRGRGQMRMGKLAPAVLALCCVWPLTGLWHGATWNYLLWGALNGAAIVVSMLMEPAFRRWMARLHIDPNGRWWSTFSVLRTFTLLALIRVFARTASVEQAMDVFRAMGDWAGFHPLRLDEWFPEIRKMHMAYAAAAMVFGAGMLIVEARGTVPMLLARFNRYPLWAKYAVAVGLLYVVMLFSATGDAVNGGFLYANFSGRDAAVILPHLVLLSAAKDLPQFLCAWKFEEGPSLRSGCRAAVEPRHYSAL